VLKRIDIDRCVLPMLRGLNSDNNMPSICRDKCKDIKPQFRGNGLYKNGFGRCNICGKFVKTDDIYCFCCGAKYRRSSRMSAYRKFKNLGTVR
jgi:hypothetical protein